MAEKPGTILLMGLQAALTCLSSPIQIRDSDRDHMIPAFLEPVLQQLLRGCLTRNYQQRLTVKDCLQLLAQSTIGEYCHTHTHTHTHTHVIFSLSAVSEENRRNWLGHLVGTSKHSKCRGDNCFTPPPPPPLPPPLPPPTPLPLPSPFALVQSPAQVSDHHRPAVQHVDVYLGSYFKQEQPYDGCLVPGWLGSIPCEHHMTYEDLFHYIKQNIPVSLHVCVCV